VSSVSSTSVTPKTSFTVTGTQLAGLTQGTNWGDESMNATNYPIFRIVNDATKVVSYAMVTNVSSTSIAPNAPATLDFTVDTTIQNGSSKLYVVASGVSSTGTAVTITGGVSAQAVSTSTTTTTKSTTITCVKGKTTKKVTGVNPKCPAGYTKK